jgi:hypothetical protein
MMKIAALSEIVGERIGFFAGLLLFSTVMYFLAAKLGVLSLPYEFFISALVAAHVAYSSVKWVVKK